MNSRNISPPVILFFSITFILFALYISENGLPELNLNNPFDYARITDVEYKAVVVDEPDQKGKVIITERLTFDIHASSKNNLFWELWRDLPEQNVDGVMVDYKVNSVKQIYPDGRVQVYDESPKLYWDDYDYVKTNKTYGPGKWFHSEGPYNPDRRRYECVLFYVDGLYREEVVFEIEYEMYNAGLRYGDCSELYLAMYSGDTIQHLDSYKAQILVPNSDMPKQGDYLIQTYGTTRNDFPCTESATANPGYYTFSVELDKSDLKFNPYNEYIEFVLLSYGDDAFSFTEYASVNDYYYTDSLDYILDEMQSYRTRPYLFFFIKVIVALALTALGLWFVIYALLTDKRMRKKYTFFSPETNYEFFRDIPSDLDPVVAANLVFSRKKSPKNLSSSSYAALLLSLARKKYISLRTLSNSDIEIKILHIAANGKSIEGLEPLTYCEALYYNLLLRHAPTDPVSRSISMKTFRSRVSTDYNVTNTFAQNMNQAFAKVALQLAYIQQNLFAKPQDELKKSRTLFYIIGTLSITLANYLSSLTRLDLAFGAYFILGILCLVAGTIIHIKIPKYLLFTQLGENEYAKWRGLYNFLNSDTLLDESTVVELPIWEKYLVYATAFGISSKVIKAIELKCREATDERPLLYNSCYRSHSFHVSGTHFHSSVRSGSYSGGSFGGSYGGGYGGGGFGGGGYGGGGRGGGGGGGGH